MSIATQPDVPLAELVQVPHPAELTPPEAPARPKSWPFRTWYGFTHGAGWLFGFVSLLACLAVLAAIPLLNFITLGYLLDVSGQVARTGRLRDGFIDIFKFARIGSMAAGTWVCLLLPRLVTSFATDAWLIDPSGVNASTWRLAQIGITVVVIAHILLAWYCGGRLRDFFWPLAPFQLAGWLLFTGPVGRGAERVIRPIWPALADDLFRKRSLDAWFAPAILLAAMRRGQMFVVARDAVWNFTVSLRLPHYFWLGLRGALGAVAWLLIPSLMLMAGTSGGGPPTILIGYLGAALMVAVVIHLPFLQTRFAAENRLAAMFERRVVMSLFARAPLAFWSALFVTLLLALPLYLFKIEPVLPEELQWTVTLFFVAFIYPARLITGWAVARASRREEPRLAVIRWLALATAIPVAAFYVVILFFTQYTSFLGPASILEQHAFLLPAPFFSL